MTRPVNPVADADATSAEHEEISKRLVAARLNAESLPGFPGILPTALADAYAIQTLSIRRWARDVGGWKVGGIPEAQRAMFGAPRLAGPIFADSIVRIEAGTSQAMPIFAGGFAALEAEFVLETARTIEPLATEYSDESLADLVKAVYIGAEIASSPMADVNKLGPCCVVSDFGNNAGLIVGPAVDDWRARSPEDMTAAVTINGAVVGTAGAAAIEGGLLSPLRFLLEVCAKRQLTLPAGTLVSTGALTGIHEVAVTSKTRVDFGASGAFEVMFEPMKPRQ